MATTEDARKILIGMISENQKKPACLTRLGNGSQRKGVRLDLHKAWPLVKQLLSHSPDLKKKIHEIAGDTVSLVTCSTVTCHGDCDQKPHRDHSFGFGKMASFVIDLDNRPLYTQFFEDWTKKNAPVKEPIIHTESVLVYDTFAVHAGSGARRFPDIKKCKHRLFCEFMDIRLPDCSAILMQVGSRMRKKYPPPLLQCDVRMQ
mmetsp:Transcript_3846/g.5865  ORF Transcript_3846/g.5865 Transcript_3846/m.5865 type:complete len:203 (-) Transcript_3846:86-694(-)